MYMNEELSKQPSPIAIGTALRAVEQQKRALPTLLNADAKAQRSALFHFLDAAADELFALVAEAAVSNARQVRVADVPMLAERLPRIFHSAPAGEFDAEMFNDWLMSKDLKHQFHTDGTYLRW